MTQRPHVATSLIAVALALVTATAAAADPQQLEFFEKEVRPLLAAHCYECHSVQSKSLKAGLRLDSRKAILKGGDTGPAITLETPKDSLILEAVRYESFEMPPKGKLADRDIRILEKWVAMGSPWPDEPEPVEAAAKPAFDLAARKAAHWCWQPIKAPAVPAVRDDSWPQSDIDRFILAKLEERGFRPALAVDRRVLIRRLSFDLTGLPPSPREIEAFVNDASPDALEQLVDRLLDSPQFGERWARHWLDLVRYAESRGHEFDNDTPNAWQYRDYVIRALNAEVPYDQFVREHIAGDLLTPPRLHAERQFNESILGTGFWHLGEWVHSPVDIRKDETDRFDNMIDVMSKAFLGVTVSCARCHDHKFDAISQKDYYALSGFLQGSDYRQVPFEALEHNKWLAHELAKIDAEANRKLRELLATTALLHLREVVDRAFSPLLPADDPGALPEACRMLVDYRNVGQVEFRQDGVIFGPHPLRAGDFRITSKFDDPLQANLIRAGYASSDPLWNHCSFPLAASPNQKGRLETYLPRSGRTLRSPTFSISTGEVRCRVRGNGMIVACIDSHRLVAGPLHGETVVVIPIGEKTDWEWVKLDLRRYQGHRAHLEFTAPPEQTLDVQLAIEGSPPERGDRLAVHMPRNPEAMVQLVRDAIDNWRADNPCSPNETRDRARIIAGALYFFSHSPDFVLKWKTEVETWKTQRMEIQAGVSRASGLAPAMLDGSGEDDRLLIRGNSSSPGEVVPRRFLEAIDGETPLEIPGGSGRLELASRITDPANPLTNRVIVNRLWQHLLGRGVVPTVDDFGALGQPPSHPELLDHLATQFVADGHSLKKMIRRIVLSQTYRMSGQVDPAAAEADPRNQWWHHLPPKRLEGETIRDSLLCVSGKLDATMYGASVPVHLTTFMEGRGRPPQSGPGDGAGRRSIYQEVRRNFLSPFLLTFDTPSPFSTMGRRNVSNVPAQALILLNDPFVRECAEAWAQRGIQEGPAEPAGHIRWFYETGLGRAPTEVESRLLQEFLGDESRSEAAVWTDVAHAIINTKEFVFLK